jgi:hypothetical protein
MDHSQKLLKSILGDRGYETLEKAIYKQRTQAVVDPLEYYLPLIVVPRTILSWLVQNINPMRQGEIKDIAFPGREDIMIHIEKQAPDQYRMEFVQGGRVIHQFEKQSLPAASGHLMSVGEMYDEFAAPKPATHDDKVNEEIKANPELNKPKAESPEFDSLRHVISMANVQPKEDPEQIKWTMSHANVREMTAVIGKLVDALTAKQLHRERLEAELDETAKEEKNMSDTTRKRADTRTIRPSDSYAQLDRNKSKDTTDLEEPPTKPEKRPEGEARTDETIKPRSQTPFKPGKQAASQQEEKPFKKQDPPMSDKKSDSGSTQDPATKPKIDPVGAARVDEPHNQTPFKPGIAAPVQQPEKPFKKGVLSPTEQRTDTVGTSSPGKNQAHGYFRKKMEMLTKPYVSEAQRGKFHAMEDRGEISHATVAHWDKASKGKHLPQHVKKEEVKPLGGTGTGAPSTPTSRPNGGFGSITAKEEKQVTSHSSPSGGGGMTNAKAPKGNGMAFPVLKEEMGKGEMPKGAGQPMAPKPPQMPKPPVPPGNNPAAQAAKQSQQSGMGKMPVPGKPKMPSMAPKTPSMNKSDYFRSKLGKSEPIRTSATEEQLYKSACSQCGVAEFVKDKDGNPKFQPCACFLVMKKDSEGNPSKFVKVLRKSNGSYSMEFAKGADPEVVKLFLLTLKSKLLIKKKFGI